ncbi:MAG: hypothetical protein ACRENP_15645 [Longimicrobiales bacterium]
MLQKNGWKQVALLSVLVFAVPLVACDREIAERPECPHNPVLRDPAGNVVEDISLSGRIIDIPEFHDCQRFIVVAQSDAKYVDIYAIYAADTLEQITDPPGSPQRPRAAATIFSYAKKATYDPLGLQPGYSCLYLEWSGTTWSAWITSQGKKDDCPLFYDGTSAQHVLEVVPLPNENGIGPGDIPSVARWDWDASRNEQYIGIRCGSRWCEIGKQGFTSSPALAVPPDIRPDERRLFLVKGWYDQQYLAEQAPDGINLRPSQTMGTIVPIHAPPGGYTKEQWEAGVDVARIYVTNDAYSEKLNLTTALPGSATPNLVRIIKPRDVDFNENKQSELPAILASASSEERQGKVIRRPASAFLPNSTLIAPRTTRWRWMKEDEGWWTECDRFCCSCENPTCT